MESNIAKKLKKSDAFSIGATVLICGISCVDIIRYCALGEAVSLVSMLIVNILFILCALAACIGRTHCLYLFITIPSVVLFFTTNNFGTTLFNFTFLPQAILSAIGAIGGTVFSVIEKTPPKKITAVFLAALLVIIGVLGGVWGVDTSLARNRKTVQNEIWGVPSFVDQTDCPEKGSIEKIDYTTKAYATDSRTVTKSAYVYLPYGYDEEKEYNILYLLHGTGDDEAYWLVKNDYNKVMVDNLIYQKAIEPLIIVTPTFYVEDDCMDGLDPLTYSFKEELRNDLMPAVEGKYATHAQGVEEKDFIESRSHRAFAGLSRGAVTTLHSVLCGSLDYFSSFGTFSASRTPAEYFKEQNQTEQMKDYAIDYWYVASGAFDFGLKSQWDNYNAILKEEPRLVSGVNTSFDVYPMRYHSMGNWHLALYNFLQKIF